MWRSTRVLLHRHLALRGCGSYVVDVVVVVVVGLEIESSHGGEHVVDSWSQLPVGGAHRQT